MVQICRKDSIAITEFELYLFSSRRNNLLKHKFSFVHCFQKGNSAVTYTTAICNGIAEMSCKLGINLLKDNTFYKSNGYFVGAAS